MAARRGGSASQAGDDSIVALKTQLYERCKLQPATKIFRQDDLLGLGVIPNDSLPLLLKVTQRLCDEKLFKILSDGSLGWQVRSQDEANKYDKLGYEEKMVYELIEEAGADGIWSKTIKTKTQLHDSLMRAALKHLESKGLIRDFKSVEHPTKKMYIKANIKPSEKTTGGPWYTDQELDEEFIDKIMDVLYHYIKSRSFYKSSTGSTRRPKKKAVTDDVKATRDAHFSAKLKREEEDENDRAAKRQKQDNLLPLPIGYIGYPTCRELTLFIANSAVTSIVLTDEDIQKLLDVLCYDDRIEQVVSDKVGVAYKAVKKSQREMEDGPNNGLTEAPCGRCPVFDLCEEGGPVGPSNCVYFQEWLNG